MEPSTPTASAASKKKLQVCPTPLSLNTDLEGALYTAPFLDYLTQKMDWKNYLGSDSDYVFVNHILKFKKNLKKKCDNVIHEAT